MQTRRTQYSGNMQSGGPMSPAAAARQQLAQASPYAPSHMKQSQVSAENAHLLKLRTKDSAGLHRFIVDDVVKPHAAIAGGSTTFKTSLKIKHV